MRILTFILSLVCLSAFAEEDIRPKMAEYDFKVTTSLAQQGDAEAQFKLGNMYRSGRSFSGERIYENGGYRTPSVYVVKKDSVEAVKWYLKSAQQGHHRAQITLAYLYCKGEGVKVDSVEAYAYYNLAGVTQSAEQKLKELENVLTPSQIEAGQKRFKELLALIEANKKPEKK